jgi:hypothetical protein
LHTENARTGKAQNLLGIAGVFDGQDLLQPLSADYHHGPITAPRHRATSQTGFGTWNAECQRRSANWCLMVVQYVTM